MMALGAMEILFELLIEVVVQIFGEALIELGVHGARNARSERPKANPVLACIAYLVLGFALGGISSFFWARRIQLDELAMLNLLVTPLLAGFAMHLFGQWRRQRGHTTTNLATFWGGTSLAFGTALARFLFA